MFDFFTDSQILNKGNSKAEGFFANLKFAKNSYIVHKKKKFGIDLKSFIALGISMALGPVGAVTFNGKKEAIENKQISISISGSQDLSTAKTKEISFGTIAKLDTIFLSKNDFDSRNIFFEKYSNSILVKKLDSKVREKFTEEITNKIRDKNLDFHKFPESEDGVWIQSGVRNKPFSIHVDFENNNEGSAFYMSANGAMESAQFSIFDFSNFDLMLNGYIKNSVE